MAGRLLKSGDGDNVAWLMQQTVVPKLMTMNAVGTGSNLVFLDKRRRRLLGYRVLKTEKLPSLGTSGDVVPGDWAQHVIADARQVEIAFSEHVRFLQTQGAWRFVSRVDGAPWLRNAVTLADATTTLSPFVGLTTSA